MRGLGLLLLSMTFACGDSTEEETKIIEGQNPGDCSDLADNDVDGDFDCDDDGCKNSPECKETDEPSTEPSGEPSSEEVDADNDVPCVCLFTSSFMSVFV